MVHAPNGTRAKWYTRQMAQAPNGTGARRFTHFELDDHVRVLPRVKRAHGHDDHVRVLPRVKRAHGHDDHVRVLPTKVMSGNSVIMFNCHKSHKSSSCLKN
jgi:hypothetical protein